MRVLRRLATLVLVAAVLILGWRFAAANSGRVPIDYLVGELPDLELWVALLGAFSAGAVLAWALALYQIAKQGLLTRRYRRAVRSLEAEVAELRNLPLREAEADAGARGEGRAAGGSEALGRGA